MTRIVLAFLVLSAVLLAESEDESRYLRMIREVMRSEGLPTAGIRFAERQPLVLIKRGDKTIGYCMEEVTWERRGPEPEDLSGITMITYGGRDERDSPGKWFKVDAPDEIAIWVAAYQHQTEHAIYHLAFVPLVPDAGFAPTRIKIESSGACMCSLGIRFYRGDKLILTAKGHLDEEPRIDSGMQNTTLHVLVRERVRKMVAARQAAERERSGEAIDDPFAEKAGTGEDSRKRDGRDKRTP